MTDLNTLPDNIVNTTSDRTGKDITGEIEVDVEDVSICSIGELAPSGAPITIPYMEVYRTNELEYVPYISPYNVGCSSDEDSSSDDSSASDSNTDSNSDNSDSNTDNSNTDTDTDTNSNSNSN